MPRVCSNVWPGLPWSKKKSDLPDDTAVHVLHHSDHGVINKDAINIIKRAERGIFWMSNC